MERGLASAKADTIELLSRLKDRPELDLTRVILAGQSRGGFLSVALAADGLPGVIGVMNFSGGWHGEPCPGGGSFNQLKFGEFGRRAAVPILSFYGDSDSYFSAGHIRTFLKLLEAQGGKSYGVILPGYSHVRPIGEAQVWGEKAMELLR